MEERMVFGMEERKETQNSPENSASAQARAGRFEEVLMREAHELVGKYQYQAAANIFQDILKRFGVALEDAQKSLLHSELGMLFYWLGDYEAGKQHCEAANAYGDNDQAYVILGKIAVAQFQFPKARGYFSKIDPKNPARPLGMCLVSIKLRDTVGAESFLREASAKISSTDPEFRTYQAYFDLLKGNTKHAVASARELVKKCERDPALLLLLAEIFMMAGNYGEATTLADKVGTQVPENDGVFAVKAHAAFADENYAEADAHAREAVRLNPFNAYAKTVLIKLATRDGSYTVAESISHQILSDSPEYSLAHANLGDVYFNQNRYELAQIEYEQSLQLMNAETKGAQLRKARMKFIAGDYHAAADILEELIEHQHTYYDDAMCDLALCYDTLGDEEKKSAVVDKMQFRRSFYHRTEKILQSFHV